MAKNYSPTNVDLLNIGNNCNLNCIHCYFQEINDQRRRSVVKDISLAKKLKNQFPFSCFFIYPMDISTSKELVPLLLEYQQKSVLSNGIELDDIFIAELLGNGVNEIIITLFSSYEEHSYFNRITADQYKKIKSNIELCGKHGLSVVVNNVLSKITKKSIGSLINRCNDLGVSKIEFIRLKPTGNARRIDKRLFLFEEDMFDIIDTIESCKSIFPNIHLRFNMSFGLDFYKKDLNQAKQKILRGANEWIKSPYLCPAIGGNYFGISMRTGNIYSCFFAMDYEEFLMGKIDLESGRIIRLDDYFLDPTILEEKLNGNCHSDNCQYKKLCLGGCRSTAFIFSKMKDEDDPLYAGMDICITKIKGKMGF